MKELLHYDPETGVFTRNYDRGPYKRGEPAGAITVQGYVLLNAGSDKYLAHRLAFLYMTGSFPSDVVDHINGNRFDNRWENLRPATRSQNLQNRGPQKQNTYRLKGVFYDEQRRKWLASIKHQGKAYFLGRHKTKEEAAHAYNKAAIELHGEFAVLNPI